MSKVATAQNGSASQRAFSEAVAALSRDMPILMHGSGDVVPSQVNPDTVQLISELTARYIANLVDAAVDAQQLLAGGKPTLPPPPRYPKSRQPPLPCLHPSRKEREKEEEIMKSGAVVLAKRPRRPDVDYWDEALPEPKIVKRQKRCFRDNLGDANGPSYVRDPNAAAVMEKEGGDVKVHPDLWVGAGGVDFWENSSRSAHVRMPDAIGVQCFIFPICHDGFLYGKVMQVQASRRAIAPVLVDSVLLDLVRTEGVLARKHAPRRTEKKLKSFKDSGDADVIEDEPEQEEDDVQAQDDEATWPGLEFLLPVHAITEAVKAQGRPS